MPTKRTVKAAPLRAPETPIQSPAHIPPVPPVAAVPAQPEPPVATKTLRIKTRYKYPIYVPHLDRLVRPDETAELDDHEWLRKQIAYGTFVEV